MKHEAHPDPDSVLRLSGDCGRLVLESGGETYRAEECMTAIAQSFGGREIESFATPTGAMFSMGDGQGKVHTLIIRIKRRATDMGALARLNDIRNKALAGEVDFRQARRMADEMQSAPAVPTSSLLSGAACVAAFFCLLFRGDWRGALISCLLGALLKGTLAAVSRDKLLSDFFLNTLGGFIVAFMARLCQIPIPDLAIDPIIIGTLMLLVPGTMIVNAIRDIIAGDLVAGVARAAEAFMSAAAISLGTALGINLAALISRLAG
jgi:uncharacterized membrane protein YjjP (DUF1212 family)